MSDIHRKHSISPLLVSTKVEPKLDMCMTLSVWRNSTASGYNHYPKKQGFHKTPIDHIWCIEEEEEEEEIVLFINIQGNANQNKSDNEGFIRPNVCEWARAQALQHACACIYFRGMGKDTVESDDLNSSPQNPHGWKRRLILLHCHLILHAHHGTSTPSTILWQVYMHIHSYT